ncbi:hypothetical protein ERJ75_001492400 [Trypanosoma vivax]|nr:hypothetical protein ERJ75_001492400 [Trypanosoma vivax]
MCYGVAPSLFDTSLSDRERLERVQAQAAHIVPTIPKGASREDALREAQLKPINEVAHRRVLEYYLRLKAKGPVHPEVATASSRPSTQSTSGLRRCSACTASMMAPKNHTTRGCWSGPGVFTSTPPHRCSQGDAPERTRRCTPCGVQRSSEFDYQLGGRVGGAGCLVRGWSAGAPEGRSREKVVLGAGSLACSDRAECVAMEAGLKRLADVVG